jgi:hypothetical protein
MFNQLNFTTPNSPAASIVANTAGYPIQQAIDGEPFDGKEMFKETLIGLATSWFPFKVRKYLIVTINLSTYNCHLVIFNQFN